MPDNRGFPLSGSERDPDADLYATPILVIEDEAIIAWLIEETLEEAGFSMISVAATGEEALAIAAERPPGIIVSDVNLGAGIDGMAATRAIRADRDLPVILLTGYATDTMSARLDGELPGARLLRKPVNGAELVRCVTRLLAS